MRKEAWNKQTMLRPTPAVQNTFYVITRNLIGLTIVFNNSCAAVVRSIELIRKRSRNFRNALRNQNVAIEKLAKFCSGYSLATNSMATQSYLLKNTATNTKFRYIFLHIARIYVFSPIIYLFLSTIWLNNIYTSK